MGKQIKTPVSVYVVHHPDCHEARVLASRLHDWFRLGHLTGDSSGAGLPIYFRRKLRGSALDPDIRFEDATLNVVIALVDHRMVADAPWRDAIVKLSNKIAKSRDNPDALWQALLVPAALHESFYRTGPLYGQFNPVRLLDMDAERQEATIRRAATEAAARMLRNANTATHSPLNVFLSHAKRDGAEIAGRIRDGVRNFGQLVAWYDANDLPFGAAWKSPMEEAAQHDTAAMVVTLTDAYPTRPWCRKEAKLARTPVRMGKRPGSRRLSRVWKVQPVVAVHRPGSQWVRGVPMLDGVPRMGWHDDTRHADTERVVDRLVLEVLLGHVNRLVAQDLDHHMRQTDACLITWLPDAWTLAALRHKLGNRAASVKRIVYPGYGMTTGEIAELKPVFTAFHPTTQLVSYEDAWE